MYLKFLFQSNFRADQSDIQISVRDRLTTGSRNPADGQATMLFSKQATLSNQMSSQSGKTDVRLATSGIKGRMLLKTESDRVHQVPMSLKHFYSTLKHRANKRECLSQANDLSVVNCMRGGGG